MSPRSLREQAYHIIYERIASGALPKGEITSEVKLSAELDMSRTPVRAALQQLEKEGFVRIVPKHGVLVLDASAQRTGDLLELMAAAVLFTVGQVRRRDPDALGEVADELSERMHAALAEINPETAAGGLCAFELFALRRIVALGFNQEMMEMLDRSASRLLWHRSGRRWAAPHREEAEAALRQLLLRLPAHGEAFPDALQRYMRQLKMTWA
ncbi:GntR family transcriptional regulator [Paenibacillus sp. MWE-103]|uniref:GntR family transcriptional regulator n=1 Tax=Paenibacillus artemisiicola TaxID=1172618 RepID=A0ABS3WKQ1_9BACL|nr:GntR family transcriptional regulator [Paenibacillus artemisiicola]MBO7748909.1 GntR family transcriptional regulator [Paenibacillus artemisiicola]